MTFVYRIASTRYWRLAILVAVAALIMLGVEDCEGGGGRTP